MIWVGGSEASGSCGVTGTRRGKMPIPKLKPPDLEPDDDPDCAIKTGAAVALDRPPMLTSAVSRAWPRPSDADAWHRHVISTRKAASHNRLDRLPLQPIFL